MPEFFIDLCSFSVEAANAEEARAEAIRMLERDPSLARIDQVVPA